MLQAKAENVKWVRHEGEIDFQPLLVAFANTQRDHTQSLASLELHSRCASSTCHNKLLPVGCSSVVAL